MTDLSFMLPRKGGGGVPRSRQEILVRLLYKRAEARRLGLDSQERLLRDQILWALPVNEPEDA